MSNMGELPTIFTFLLLCAAELTQCFPVSQGGNRSVQVFFCKNPGCAANVSYIFCNNERVVFNRSHITECSGPPPPNDVCQHDGRAFVSTDTAGGCEFENEAFMDTEKCPDKNNICAFINATTPSPVTTEGTPKYHGKREQTVGAVVGGAVGGVVGVLLLIAVVYGIVYCYRRRQNKEENPARDSGVNVPLNNLQSPGETSESDTCGGPGLDDGSSSQRE